MNVVNISLEVRINHSISLMESFKNILNALPFNLKISTQTDSLAIPTPIHRLDNLTSGLLLIAKTKTAQIELGKEFANNTIQKCF